MSQRSMSPNQTNVVFSLEIATDRDADRRDVADYQRKAEAFLAGVERIVARPMGNAIVFTGGGSSGG